jgi:hypothetical protein
MAVLTMRNQLTIVELAKRQYDGNMLEIAEVLEQTNEMLEDAIWLEANGATHHVITIRASLPEGDWRVLNDGVGKKASATRQEVEEMGMLEAYSEVDSKLVELAANPQEFRSQEDLAFVEGLSQQLQTAIIYGDFTANPEQFNGLTTRYNALSLANVHDGGGTGSDVTSIWIIQWGKTRIHLIYPKGSRSMGVSARDLGEDTVAGQTANTQFQAFRTLFQIHCGLVVRDPRCAQRYANIETSGASNIFDPNVMIDALNLMPQRGKGCVIYGNRTIMSQVDKNAADKTNVQYTVGEEFGREVNYFRTHPVKLVEKLVNTEDAVS